MLRIQIRSSRDIFLDIVEEEQRPLMSPIELVAEKQEQTFLADSTARQKYKIMEYELYENSKKIQIYKKNT